jgi:hypothetical protein
LARSWTRSPRRSRRQPRRKNVYTGDRPKAGRPTIDGDRAQIKRAGVVATHRFKFDQILEAYGAFSRAADTQALKVVIAA